jgi:hypothetical protein
VGGEHKKKGGEEDTTLHEKASEKCGRVAYERGWGATRVEISGRGVDRRGI